MQSYSSRMRLIEHLYQVVIDPLCYEDLLDEWDHMLLDAQSRQTGASEHDEISTHAIRASQIIKKLQASSPQSGLVSLAEIIEADPNPAILLDDKYRIAAANVLANEQFGLEPDNHLDRLMARQSSSNSSQNSKGFQAEEPGESSAVRFVQLETVANHEPVLFALSPVECAVDKSVVGMLTKLAPIWSVETVEALRSYFGLTDAETSVIRDIMNGATAGKLATTRKTSLNTVRTQIKSILVKTGYTSQVELIRNFGFLQQFGMLDGN